MKKVISLLIVLTMLVTLTACKKSKVQDSDAEPQNIPETGQTAAAEDTDFKKTDSEMFTKRDGTADYDESTAIKIELSGTGATASSESVQIAGGKITLTENATYIISGVLEDGQIIVAAPDTAKLQIVLNGANITSVTSAPIYIKSADKVFLTLVDENTLSNGGSFDYVDENNIDGVIFSKQDLTLNGTGTLTLTSPASHGIVCKDDLVLTGGSYSITSASHAIEANDSVRIKNATLTLASGKDGIHAENTDDTSRGFVYIASGTLDITAEGDGISASSYAQIVDGDIKILAGGGYENGREHSSDGFGGFPGGGGGPGGGRPPRTASELSNSTDDSTSMKGLKASGILIGGGTFNIDSADDALHSNASLTVNGGSFEIATGDDALHAEETLTVTGGNINISKSYEGLEALNIYIKGGDISLVATDDGLNAAGGNDASGMGGRDEMFGGRPGGPGGMSANSNGSVNISGGTLYINSSGDAIDANGTLEISGGHTTVVGPTQGDTATLDYDRTGIITCGTFIGTGASGGMTQTFSSSEQGVITLRTNAQAGTKITVADSDGNLLIAHNPELPFGLIIISSPELVSGEKYTVTVGESSNKVTAD